MPIDARIVRQAVVSKCRMPFKASHVGIMKALLNSMTKNRFGILCVGERSVDEVFSVPFIPAPAEKIVATRARWYPDGTTAT
jgi:hypothetical protein